MSFVADALCQLLGVAVELVITVGEVGRPVRSANATFPFLPTSLLGIPGVAAGVVGENGNPAIFRSSRAPSSKTRYA